VILFAEHWIAQLHVGGRWLYAGHWAGRCQVTRDRRLAASVGRLSGPTVLAAYNADRGEGDPAVAWRTIEVPPYGADRVIAEG